MALIDIDEKGRTRKVRSLNYIDRFEKIWNAIPPREQRNIEDEINRRLDELSTVDDQA